MWRLPSRRSTEFCPRIGSSKAARASLPMPRPRTLSRIHSRIDRSGQTWVEDTNHAGFSGASAMLSDPDNDVIIDTDVQTTSPELTYDMDISTTGDYIIWVRMMPIDSDGNSVHVGIDGVIDPLSKGIQTQALGNWIWLSLSRGSNALEQSFASCRPTARTSTPSNWPSPS